MKLKLIAIALLWSSITLRAQTVQVVDLTTGLGTPVGGVDARWTVKTPGSGIFQNVMVSNRNLYFAAGPILYNSVYPGAACGNWVSPYTITTAGPTFGAIPSSPTGIGAFQYKMTFNSEACAVTGAVLNMNKAGADNSMDGITINGHYHNLSAQAISFSSLKTFSIAIPASDIISGANTVIVNVTNGDSYTGMLICGDLTITYAGDPNITPSISGATNFCSGNPISFTGSTGTSTSTNYYWEIVESDASGNPTGIGYSWNSWFPGTPGAFTFPNSSTIPCGKYYKIKLAVQNACVSWVEISKVIYIYCTPSSNAGPDITICNGSCGIIGTYVGMIKFTSFNWYNSSGYVGNGQQISVCPTTTTTYTLTVSNTLTGCSSSDVVTVNVEDNNPAFSLASNLNASDNFFTTTGTPVVTNVSGIAGFGFSWIVEEIVSPANTTVVTGSQVVNSSCWWSGLVSVFNGYDGYALPTPMAGGCSSPAVGHFAAGHTYRITRGTWSNTCSWQQYSAIVYMTHSMAGNNITVVEDHTAPDYSSLITTGIPDIKAENSISVYPNPGNGIFSIELAKAATGTLEIYNAVGERVQKMDVQDNTSVYKMDLSGYSKGIYMLNFISNDQKYSKKLIVQ